MSDVVSLADKLARAKAKLPTPPAPPVAPPTPPSAPAVTFMAGSSGRSENDRKIDEAVDSVDIIQAYNLWAGKGTADARGRTESIKVRCPNPAHLDNDPSAWINTDKGTWYCGGCEEGGDKFDIAAWHYGLPVPGYKDGKLFHELRRRIAESQGYVIQPTPAGPVVYAPGDAVDSGPTDDRPEAPLQPGREVYRPVADSEVGPDGATHASAPIAPPDAESASVTRLPVGPLEEDDGHELDADIELNWKAIVPKGTFLETYMKQTTIDDVPEEYHFWNGLLAIASACGRDVTLADLRPVYANMFICFLGRTGKGKSKAKYQFDRLLETALPYDHTDPYSKGVLRVASPASAEALIWTFKKELEDPTTPKKVELYPVKGVVDFNELSSLVGRANRAGNVLVPTLMQFYDMEDTVETVSRTHGREKAVQPFACAVTTSQPRALRGLLSMSDAASGFLNRWFFAAGKGKKRVAIGGARIDIMPAVKPLQEIRRWAIATGEIEWSQEAHDLFTSFFDNELEKIMKQDETDLLNRLDLFCKKLVLLFTANMRHTEVQVEAVEQTMRLLPYILDCYGIPGATVGSSLQQEIREAILKVVIQHQEVHKMGASSRDIQRRLQRRKYPLDLFNRTLKYMLEIEEIVVMPAPPGPGRPTTRYGVLDLEDAKAYLDTSLGKTDRKAASG